MVKSAYPAFPLITQWLATRLASMKIDICAGDGVVECAQRDPPMAEPAPSKGIIRFGVFEVDLAAGELHRNGLRVRMQEKPFQVLALLLERPGEVVTRDELQQRLWPDIFVDVEHSLTTAIKKLRDALEDPADNPRFVETRPGRGYRFIAPIEQAGSSLGTGGQGRKVWRWAAVGLGVAAALAAVLVGLNVGGARERLFGRAAPKIESLAVLPLENLSHDPEQEYFADGMTGALIAELSKIRALKVISRTSVMQYKGAKKPLPQIARELNVDGVIEGTVQREGDQVRISVQLIHGPTDKHLWEDSYQREMRGILALQGEVARDIAQEIRVQLTPQEQVRLASTRSINPEAYDAYLKGWYYIIQFANEQREEPIRKSIEYYEEAIRLDPGFAPAYADLSIAYRILASDFGGREVDPKAKAAALKALELDDNLGRAHMAVGSIKLREWDWPSAEREFKRAIELDPSYPWAHTWYAFYLMIAENYERALAEHRRAEELDPLVLAHKANIAWVYDCARQYDQAIEQHRKTLALNPNAAWLHDRLGGAYVGKGMYEEALDEFQKGVKLSGGDPRYRASPAWAYAMAGKRAEALKILDEFKEPSKRKFLKPFDRASIYAALGEKEQAFIWLEKTYEERSEALPFIHCDSEFDKLRGDPRFQDLLRRMNLPQ